MGSGLPITRPAHYAEALNGKKRDIPRKEGELLLFHGCAVSMLFEVPSLSRFRSVLR